MADGLEQFISIKRYAELRRCSATYMHRLKREGRLVDGPGNLIDWKASDAKLHADGDPLRGGDRSVPAPDAPRDDPGTDPADVGPGSVREAVRRERLANARMAEIKLGEQTKELTRTKEVDRLVFTLVRQAMERFRSVGSRLRGKLAAETDPRACEAMLDAETHLICADMQRAADDVLAAHNVDAAKAAA